MEKALQIMQIRQLVQQVNQIGELQSSSHNLKKAIMILLQKPTCLQRFEPGKQDASTVFDWSSHAVLSL